MSCENWCGGTAFKAFSSCVPSTYRSPCACVCVCARPTTWKKSYLAIIRPPARRATHVQHGEKKCVRADEANSRKVPPPLFRIYVSRRTRISIAVRISPTIAHNENGAHDVWLVTIFDFVEITARLSTVAVNYAWFEMNEYIDLCGKNGMAII